MNQPLTETMRPLLAALLVRLDPVVAEMVVRCDVQGHGVCDWTCRMRHHYIELREAWHEAGGCEKDLPSLRLTREGNLIHGDDNVQR